MATGHFAAAGKAFTISLSFSTLRLRARLCESQITFFHQVVARVRRSRFIGDIASHFIINFYFSSPCNFKYVSSCRREKKKYDERKGKEESLGKCMKAIFPDIRLWLRRKIARNFFPSSQLYFSSAHMFCSMYFCSSSLLPATRRAII